MDFDFNLQPGKKLYQRYKPYDAAPLISVITPYFNAGKYIAECLHCLQNQTFPWFEWVIMDDGSTNPADTQILETIASQDNRIRVFHKENGGAASARNEAVREAASDFLFFYDADDLIEDTMLEILYIALQQNPEAGWAYTDIATFGDHEYLWSKDFSSDIECRENVVSIASLVRKSVFEQVGGFSVFGRYFNEDWHLWLKILALNIRPVHIRLYLFWYRRLSTGGLAVLDRDPHVKKMNEQIIREAAKAVPSGIEALHFYGYRNYAYTPVSRWNTARELPFAAEKTRILLIIPHMARGGADLFNLDLMQGLDPERFEIGVMATLPTGNEWRQLHVRAANDLFELTAFLDPSDWPAFIEYYIRTRNVKIVVNISSQYAYYLFPWLRAQFPEIVLIDFVHAESKYWLNGGHPRVSGAMDSVLDHTYATNDFTMRRMAQFYGKLPEEMSVIHTGVDDAAFTPDPEAGRLVRKNLGLEGRPVVLFLCRISPEKRPFLMLEIAKAVAEAIPNVCFLVVGGGGQYPALVDEVTARHLERTVVFTGVVPQTEMYYDAADLLLLCSLKEGLSITTIEAMMKGIPVVSADVGSQYELVNGGTGALVPCLQDEKDDFDSRSFPQKEIDAYRSAIVALLQDRPALERMGEVCRSAVVPAYTKRITMQTIEREFDILVQDEAHRAKRKAKSSALQPFEKVFEEFLVLFQEFNAVEAYANTLYSDHSTLQKAMNEIRKGPVSLFSMLRKKHVRQKLKALAKRLLKSKC